MSKPLAANAAERAPVLYALACGSPPAGYLGRLVTLAQQAGWQVCVVATPDGRRFIDAPGLAAQTGYPVRSHFRSPGDPDVLPGADAMVVAPATVNTVNKWASGIADTLALGMLVEGYGLGLPIVVMPYTNVAMAAHPAFHESLRRLRAWGVQVLFGEDVLALPEPGGGVGQAARFPWPLALAAVGPPRRRSGAPTPREPVPVPVNLGMARISAVAGQPGQLSPVSRNRRSTLEGRSRLSPPASPRPAPAIVRPSGVGEPTGRPATLGRG